MKRHKCCINRPILQHLLKFVAPTDAAFKARPEEPLGLAPRGLAAVLCEDGGDGAKPHGDNGKANLIDFTVSRQRRVVRSTFSADLNGLVDSTVQMLSLQCVLYQIYCGTARNPERMIDLLERGLMYPPLDLCADARASYDALSATDACELGGSSLKLHLISVRDRMSYGLIRKVFWVDTRDMFSDGLTKGGIDRLLLHNVSNDCTYQASCDAFVHPMNPVVSATIP